MLGALDGKVDGLDEEGVLLGLDVVGDPDGTFEGCVDVGDVLGLAPIEVGEFEPQRIV